MNSDEKQRLIEEKQRLSDQIAGLRVELYKLEAIEKHEFNLPLIGKCFKYRNSFSCPETDADYWWQYEKIIGIDNDTDQLKVWTFEHNKDNTISICFSENRYSVLPESKEISNEEFMQAWEALVNKIIAREGTKDAISS